MTALVFVDTNVLVYAVDRADPKKHEAGAVWRAALWKSRRGRISFQVLQEFYVTVVRKDPMSQRQAREEVRDLLAWKPVAIDAGTLDRAWSLQDRYRLSFWDALIVGAARVASCRYLLTENLQPGQDLDGITVVNPFEATLADLA